MTKPFSNGIVRSAVDTGKKSEQQEQDNKEKL